MANILLAIHPRYVNNIFKHIKWFEFRRKIPAKDFSGDDLIIFYETAPTKKIVGQSNVKDVIRLEVDELWERCKEGAGTSQKDFLSYFLGVRYGYALELTNVKKYQFPIDPYSIFLNYKPPQFFHYLAQFELDLIFNEVEDNG
jgi:predicted transcriptional regulator